MDSLDEVEQDARFSALFGDAERAAHLYGKAVEIARKTGCSSEKLSDLMIRAANALTESGMSDDAFDGLRILSLEFIKQQQFGAALRLGVHLTKLHHNRPDLFPNAVAFCAHIKTLCERQTLAHF